MLTFFSGAEIGRFVAMLRNPSPILRACAAFALLQVCFFYPFSTSNAVSLKPLSRDMTCILFGVVRNFHKDVFESI